MTEPIVVAGCVAKNRAWALGSWYDAMEAQTRRPDRVRVLLNDCDDSSEQICYERGDDVTSDYWVLTTGDPGCERVATAEAPRYSIAHLAMLRNEFVDRTLERWPQATHLFSVDSDVIVDPDVLEKLLAADKAVIAATVCNSRDQPVWNFFVGSDDEGPRRTPMDQFGITGESVVQAKNKIAEVTMTGACVLIRRDVLDAGVRYADHPRGEDVAWSMAATKAGFSLYVHPQARTSHVQRNGEAWR